MGKFSPKPCVHCGTLMVCSDKPGERANWDRKKYCSERCKRRENQKRYLAENITATDKQKYRGHRDRQRALAAEARRQVIMKETKTCKECGKEFTCEDTPNARSVWSRRLYCSNRCGRVATERLKRTRLHRAARAAEAEQAEERKARKSASIEIGAGARLTARLDDKLVSALREALEIHPDFAIALFQPGRDMMSAAFPSGYSPNFAASLKGNPLD